MNRSFRPRLCNHEDIDARGAHEVQGRRAAVRTLALYVAAGIVWVAIGVGVPEFMLAWPVTVAYLVLVAWLAPAAVRRLR